MAGLLTGYGPVGGGGVLDNSFGIPNFATMDPASQQGMMAALRSAQPALQAFQNQQPQQGAKPQPITQNSNLWGAPGQNGGAPTSGLLGSGGFSNSLQTMGSGYGQQQPNGSMGTTSADVGAPSQQVPLSQPQLPPMQSSAPPPSGGSGGGGMGGMNPMSMIGGGGGGAGAGVSGGGVDAGMGGLLGGTGAGTGAAAGGAGDSALAALAWIVCTQLMRDGRLPKRFWIYGSKEFAGYSERVKRGYYFYAIPAVRHLRAHPESRLSKALEIIFNHRAEYLAAKGGCASARKTLRGWFFTKALMPIGFVTGTFVREMPDWSVLYREAA
jgi:hypothetical protein